MRSHTCTLSVCDDGAGHLEVEEVDKWELLRWGIEWNVALDTGGVLVGDKVKIELDIQAAKA